MTYASLGANVVPRQPKSGGGRPQTGQAMQPTPVFDTYWHFAIKRMEIFHRRREDDCGPWTDDDILRRYRFTNVYRATDRVSQYLIRQVQYRKDRSDEPREIFFRTMLFKVFNRVDTWESLEQRMGSIAWNDLDKAELVDALDDLMRMGRRIYSAAYIMPSPQYGHARKHANHVAMLTEMMADRLPERICEAPSLKRVYELLLSYPGIGPFLAFQYAIDLNYSSMLDFEEGDFVVAGPGAVDGISKCFEDGSNLDPSEVIHEMVSRQSDEFARLGLNFEGLFGRPLQPIDCQNLFCEISKYARVAHPDVKGVLDRSRIKQAYKPDYRPMDELMFPPKWALDIPVRAPRAQSPKIRPALQLSLI